MVDVDTSSYLKATPPVNPLDIAGKLGGLQSQALGINQQKLDQANQALGYMTRSMASLGPNASKDDYLAVGQNAVKMGLVPQNMLNTYVERLNAAKSPQDFYNEFVTAAATHKETIDYHLGNQTTMDNGQAIQPIAISPKPGFNIRSTGAPIQRQLPVTTPTVETDPNSPNYQSPVALGPQPLQAAPGNVTAPPPMNAPALAVTPPAMPRANVRAGPALVENKVQDRVMPRVPLALPPGVAEAQKTVRGASGTAVAEELNASRNYQREIFPLIKAIPALEALGTKGTGPGTETINNLKSFVLSNVPGVKEGDFNNTVKDYDTAKKYLVDFVNQTGNTGTNDKLAAAFSGNPSVGISNAAAVDVAKSALALRTMRQAQIMEFRKTGQGPDKFSDWAANWADTHDPRAFGVNLLSDKAAKKLYDDLTKPGHEKERTNFENSLQTAYSLGLIKKP